MSTYLKNWLACAPLLLTVACAQILPSIAPDPLVAERAAIQARCDKDLMLAAELQRELEQLEPPYTAQTVLKPYNRFDMLLGGLWVDVQLYEAVHPDAEIRRLSAACKLRVAGVYASVDLSQSLYLTLSKVDVTGAHKFTQRYLDKTLADFRLAGVDRDSITRTRLEQLDGEIEALKQTFSRNLREDTRYLTLDSVAELAGLPEDYIAAHPPGENGKIQISTKYPDYIPLMTYAELDWVRRDMAKISGNRGWPANKTVFETLLRKRHEYASLLGYDNYADYVTADKMSGSGVIVAKFIDQLAEMSGSAAEEQYRQLLIRKKRIELDATVVNSWEKSYLSELVRRERYQVDSAMTREYFGYADTRDAMFILAERLFGLSVRPWDTKTWHPDVEAYELMDGQRILGRFYLDMHPREGKHQHTTHFPLQVGVANRQLPMSALVTNFPGAGDPQARMEHDDVVSFAHEFGHLLHRQLSGHFEWAGLVGSERDFTEAPSQMLEEWVWDPAFLSSFARNRAGEPIPDELVANMIRARNFGKALSVRGQLYLAAMSFNYHNYAPEGMDLDALMIAMKSQYSLFDHQPDTHSWANFGHLMGYSALYYSYLWSEVIALDMFSEFEREGLFDTAVADRYRAAVLAAGATLPAAELVEKFLGRPVRMDAFARRLSQE